MSAIVNYVRYAQYECYVMLCMLRCVCMHIVYVCTYVLYARIQFMLCMYVCNACMCVKSGYVRVYVCMLRYASVHLRMLCFVCAYVYNVSYVRYVMYACDVCYVRYV